MNRPLTALFAALESLLVGGLGLGVLLVPLTALWAFGYDLGIDWTVFYRIAANAWLLGHGVDVQFALSSAVAPSLGLAGADQPFVVTIAVLGGSVLTAVLAARTGARLAETDHPRVATVASVACFAAIAAAITLTAGGGGALPSRWQGFLLPTLVFIGGVVAGWTLGRRERATRPPWRETTALLVAAARLGLASAAGLVAVASVVLAALLAVRYSTVISLYESLQAGPLGGAVLTIAQLALLPDLVIWTAAWLAGPGFALGAGSSISPLGSTVGPVPALPVFGAVPPGEHALGFLGLLAPLVLAFLLGAVLRPRLDRTLRVPATWTSVLLVGAGAGAVGGLAIGVLCWAASGAAGPGRLASVGPEPLLVGIVAALEFAVAGSLGLLTGRARAAAER